MTDRRSGCEIVTLERGSVQLEYGLTVHEVMLPNGNLLAESYGIRVIMRDVDSQEILEESHIPHVTSSAAKIEGFLSLLQRNLVTPYTLEEILEELLA